MVPIVHNPIGKSQQLSLSATHSFQLYSTYSNWPTKISHLPRNRLLNLSLILPHSGRKYQPLCVPGSLVRRPTYTLAGCGDGHAQHSGCFPIYFDQMVLRVDLDERIFEKKGVQHDVVQQVVSSDLDVTESNNNRSRDCCNWKLHESLRMEESSTCSN